MAREEACRIIKNGGLLKASKFGYSYRNVEIQKVNSFGKKLLKLPYAYSTPITCLKIDRHWTFGF